MSGRPPKGRSQEERFPFPRERSYRPRDCLTKDGLLSLFIKVVCLYNRDFRKFNFRIKTLFMKSSFCKNGRVYSSLDKENRHRPDKTLSRCCQRDGAEQKVTTGAGDKVPLSLNVSRSPYPFSTTVPQDVSRSQPVSRLRPKFRSGMERTILKLFRPVSRLVVEGVRHFTPPWRERYQLSQ